MTLVRVLSQKFESIMKDSPTQSLLFEDDALECYKNNIKWVMSRNISMKKLAKDNFSKPESKNVSNMNNYTNNTSMDIENRDSNSQIDNNVLANEIEK